MMNTINKHLFWFLLLIMSFYVCMSCRKDSTIGKTRRSDDSRNQTNKEGDIKLFQQKEIVGKKKQKRQFSSYSFIDYKLLKSTSTSMTPKGMDIQRLLEKPANTKIYIQINPEVKYKRVRKLLNNLWNKRSEYWVTVSLSKKSSQQHIPIEHRWIIRTPLPKTPPKRIALDVKTIKAESSLTCKSCEFDRLFSHQQNPCDPKMDYFDTIRKSQNEIRNRAIERTYRTSSSYNNPYTFHTNIALSISNKSYQISVEGSKVTRHCKPQSSLNHNRKNNLRILKKKTVYDCLLKIRNERKCSMNLILCISDETRWIEVWSIYKLLANNKSRKSLFSEFTISDCTY